MTINELVKINKDVFVKTTGTLLKTEFLLAFPYLKFLSPAINKIIDIIVSFIASKLELLSYFIYIDYRVDQEGKDFVLAAQKANIDQTEESRKLADEKFHAFIKFTY